MAKRSKKKTRKKVPWSGWGKIAPQGHARTVMLKKCGRKCFLGPKKSFPICRKGTCKISPKGLYSAYIRSRQWGGPKSKYRGKSRPRHRRSLYNRIARKSKAMLRRRGYSPGGRKKYRLHSDDHCDGDKKLNFNHRRRRGNRLRRRSHSHSPAYSTHLSKKSKRKSKIKSKRKSKIKSKRKSKIKSKRKVR